MNGCLTREKVLPPCRFSNHQHPINFFAGPEVCTQQEFQVPASFGWSFFPFHVTGKNCTESVINHGLNKGTTTTDSTTDRLMFCISLLSVEQCKAPANIDAARPIKCRRHTDRTEAGFQKLRRNFASRPTDACGSYY